MVKKLKVASLGLGGIVKNRLVDGIEKSRYCTFLGAYDPNMTEEGAQFLAEHDTRLYSTEAGLVSDPDVDIVLVASPHHEHFRQAEMALNAGKHVWVEKPLATRFSEADSLYKLAIKKRLGLNVDSMMTNNWLNKKAVSLIQQGKIGALMRVETSMEFPYDDYSNFRYTETNEEGGGSAWDVGPHCLYMAMMLADADKIVDISARFGQQRESNVPPNQSLYMMFGMAGAEEVTGVSNTSFTTDFSRGFGSLLFRVLGTDGIIEGHGTMFQHSESGQEGNDQHLVFYRGGKRREIRTPKRGAPNIYAKEFDVLAGPVARGEEPPIDALGVSLVGVVEAALASAASGGKLVTTDKYFRH